MIGTLAALPATASLLIVPRRFFSLISLGMTPWVRLPPTFPCSWTISFWQSITRIAVLPFGSVRVLMFFPPFRTLAPPFSVQGEGSGEELVKRPEAGDEGRRRQVEHTVRQRQRTCQTKLLTPAGRKD